MKILESEHGSESRKHTCSFWEGRLWAFIWAVAFGVVFPIGSAAQTGVSGGGGGYGTGVQSPLQFAGEGAPSSQLSLSLGASTFYDDNVLSTNGQRHGDEAVSLSSHLGVTETTERLTFGFNYTPYFQFYRQFDQFDRLSHAGNLNLNYRLAERFSLGLYDTLSYQYGFLPYAGQQQEILSGPIPPTALNQGIFTYTTRTLVNTAGLRLTFAKSRRTSFSISGSYNLDKFGSESGESQGLYNGREVTGGLHFQYLVTSHTRVGVLALHQDATYQGGGVFGYRERSQIETAYLSVESDLSPTVSVSVYGGPQYLHIISGSFVGEGATGQLEGAGGGSITKEVRNTALNLAFQRSVTDGGGLYTDVINTYATFGARRRLVGRWEASCSGGAEQAETPILKISNETTRALMVTAGVSRPIRGNAALSLSYTTTHEMNKGNLPFFVGFDSNYVTLGFNYQLKTIPLGR